MNERGPGGQSVQTYLYETCSSLVPPDGPCSHLVAEDLAVEVPKC